MPKILNEQNFTTVVSANTYSRPVDVGGGSYFAFQTFISVDNSAVGANVTYEYSNDGVHWTQASAGVPTLTDSVWQHELNYGYKWLRIFAEISSGSMTLTTYVRIMVND